MKPAAPALLAIAVALAVLQSACATHKRPVEAPTHPTLAKVEDFLELQPGWKVLVVVPMLRSGGYLLPSTQTKTTGSTVEIQAGDELLGYQTDHYAISSRQEGGIAIRFVRGEVWENGKTHRAETPRLALFAQAQAARYIRLVYLTRISQADHNMAIVAAANTTDLNEATRLVTQQAECRSVGTASCVWVPAGVAVRRE